MKLIYIYFLCVIIFSIASCDEMDPDLPKKDFTPIDLTSVVYRPSCNSEGIFPDFSILKNSQNPFIKAGITEHNKWDIYSAGTFSSASKYYYWATLLAKNPSGENQYLTAEAVEANEGTSSRAFDAYKEVVMSFYNDIIYEEETGPPVKYIPRYVSQWSCEALYDRFYDAFDEDESGLKNLCTDRL